MIFLLDEPGLSLHAGAQKDLMDLMFDISKENQVIFNTHSPFMAKESEGRIYCVTGTDEGSVIRKAEDETDKETLMSLVAI
ncbi:MAG: ATP-binding protein [Lachnospiraceae bacterium]|nr:ATP-binding protein [Lachnospiraceae bacterium]